MNSRGRVSSPSTRRRRSDNNPREQTRDKLGSPAHPLPDFRSGSNRSESVSEETLKINSPVPRIGRSLSITKTSFSPISKSCPYENLREIGLRMSQEISCRDVRPHILWPTYASVFRGKEAFIWIQSCKETNLILNKSSSVDSSSSDDQNSSVGKHDKRGWATDVLNWMLREKIILRF